MGDVVLVSDANMMRGQWRIGLVIKCIPSSDGYVRRVMLKLTNFRKDNQGKTIVEVERAVRNTIVLVPVDDCTD